MEWEWWGGNTKSDNHFCDGARGVWGINVIEEEVGVGRQGYQPVIE